MLKPLSASKWDVTAAGHFLNRAGFGGPPAEIERLVSLGPERAVSILVDFEKIPDSSDSVTDLSSALELMLGMLERNGIRRVLRVVFTSSEHPLQVLRVLAPGLECFNQTSVRIGVRLRDYVRDKL